MLENPCKLWQNILEHLEVTIGPKPIFSGKNLLALKESKCKSQDYPRHPLFSVLLSFD